VTHEDIAVESTSKPERTDDFLKHAQTRLDGAGFSWTDGAEGFRAVATRSSLQLTKFGFWETFFVFREFERLDRGSMQAFVRDAVQYAFANRSVKLPRGCGRRHVRRRAGRDGRRRSAPRCSLGDPAEALGSE
jgi:hypothetical protein